MGGKAIHSLESSDKNGNPHMRKSRIGFFWIFLLGVSLYACYVYFCFIYINRTQCLKNKHKLYYVPMDISRFDGYGLPYLSLKIENQTMLALLDLGFQGYFAISSSILDDIQDKKHLYLKTYCGIFGAEHQNNVYQIPRAEVGSLKFTRATVYEASDDFFASSVFFSEGNRPRVDKDQGIIGWRAFSRANLFLDTTNSLVGFADSLETLQQNGYADRHFIKVPLLLDRGFVEIEVEGPMGSFRCVLDTGASYSIMHTECKEGQAPEQAIWENISNDTSLIIGGESFGPILFLHFPIHLPLPLKVDAILGMEFLKEHIVFIDFAEGYVYLAKRALSGCGGEGSDPLH